MGGERRCSTGGKCSRLDSMLRSKPEMGGRRTALGCDACGGFESMLGSMVQEPMASAVGMCGGFDIEVPWSGLEMRREVSTDECGVCSRFKLAMGAALGGKMGDGCTWDTRHMQRI
jgi:hypothetical protein